MVMQICSQCNVEKCEDEYYKDKRRPSGLWCTCKQCVSIRRKEKYRDNRKKHQTENKQNYIRNKEKRLEYCKKYYRENKDKVKASVKRYYSENKELCNKRKNKYRQLRSKSDPMYRMKRNISRQFSLFLKGTKTQSTWKYVNYTLEELKLHLESQFRKGMSWDNYGRGGWHIDHIKPKCRFDHTDPTQISECWALSNLQPLWERENLIKGGFYNE